MSKNKFELAVLYSGKAAKTDGGVKPPSGAYPRNMFSVFQRGHRQKGLLVRASTETEYRKGGVHELAYGFTLLSPDSMNGRSYVWLSNIADGLVEAMRKGQYDVTYVLFKRVGLDGFHPFVVTSQGRPARFKKRVFIKDETWAAKYDTDRINAEQLGM